MRSPLSGFHPDRTRFMAKVLCAMAAGTAWQKGHLTFLKTTFESPKEASMQMSESPHTDAVRMLLRDNNIPAYVMGERERVVILSDRHLDDSTIALLTLSVSSGRFILIERFPVSLRQFEKALAHIHLVDPQWP